MNKVAIVYWSGTGDSEVMTSCIAEGVRPAAGKAEPTGPVGFAAGQLTAYSAGDGLPDKNDSTVDGVPDRSGEEVCKELGGGLAVW